MTEVDNALFLKQVDTLVQVFGSAAHGYPNDVLVGAMISLSAITALNMMADRTLKDAYGVVDFIGNEARDILKQRWDSGIRERLVQAQRLRAKQAVNLTHKANGQ